MNRKKIFCLLGLTCVAIAGISSVNQINTFASDETQKMYFKKATSLVTNSGQVVVDKMPSDSQVYIIDEKLTDPAVIDHYNGKKNSQGKRPRKTYFVKETYIGRVTLFSPIISNKSNSIYKNINTHISGPSSLYENVNFNGGLSKNKKNYRVAENTGCNGTIDGTIGGKPRHTGYHSYEWHVKEASWLEGNKKYEYRYLGYSDKGAVIANPFFPSDSPLGSEILEIGKHPWAKNPWNVVGNTPNGKDVIVKKSYYDDEEHPDLVKQKREVFQTLKVMHNTMKNKSDAYWAERMSLRNNPLVETPVLTGGRLVNGTVWYRSATVVEDDRPGIGEKNEKNLAVDKLIVKDSNGTEVGNYTRSLNNPMIGKATGSLLKGQKYTVDITIADKGPATVENKATVDNGVMPGASSSADTDIRAAKINNDKTTDKEMKEAKTQVVSYEFIVPTDNQEKYTVQSRIANKHTFNGENTKYDDDTALIQFNVKDGDLIANKVHLWNETKQRYEDASKTPNKDLPGENTIVPGDKYQVGFEGNYEGETVYDNNGVPVTKEFIVHTYVKKFAKSGESQIEQEDVKVKVKLEKGAKFIAWTPTKLYECPRIEAEAVISSQTQKDGYNLRTDNDNWDKDYSSPYDIKIDNAILLPKTEMINGKQQIKIAVKYDAYLDVPRGNNDYQIDTKTLIKIGNSNKTVTDHLKKGWNKNIVHEIIIDASPGQKIPGSIFINGDKGSWEDDKFINPQQRNNKANAHSMIGVEDDMKVIVNPPKNPYNGACSLNGVRTSKTWNQKYSVMSWSAKKTDYTINDKLQQYYDFTITSNQDISRNQFEKYKIDGILFKSKMTEDLKMGSAKDGWVDLKTEKGKIKAGYGYELKIKTSYKTNAFETQPKDSINEYAGTGTWVRPKHVAPNLPNDLYVRTPDGKILSVSGVHGTSKGLKFQSSGDVVKNGSQTWTYEIKPSNSLGFKEAGKLFVSEDTPDGDYSLQIFTPDINGISTTPGYGQDYLCDSNKVTITVDGAMTDDLNDHLTQ